MTAEVINLADAVARLTEGVTIVPDSEWEEPPRFGDRNWVEGDTDWTAQRLAHAKAPPKQTRLLLAKAMKPCRAVDLVRAFMTAPPGEWGFLVLSGPKDCGKTQAAVWALSQVSNGRFIRSDELSRIDSYAREEHAMLHDPALLVIDDLGTEFMDKKGFLLRLIDSLIDGRYSFEKRTIITTNLRADDHKGKVGFKTRYGARIQDRMKECGVFEELKTMNFRKPRATSHVPKMAKEPRNK